VSRGKVYRQVNPSYYDNYNLLIKSGLYGDLVGSKSLIPHKVNNSEPLILHPQQIPYISYPYEWCFSQLKDAALLTLDIQMKSLEYGMSLKDASAYNVQFLNGKPIFIDTLSFEKYEGYPWVAYGQFCQHFLAPLALMAYKDVRLNQLSRIYLDGIPLDLASKLLPFRSHFNLYLELHLHLHAKTQNVQTGVGIDRKISLHSSLGIVDTLRTCVNSLKWKPKGQWRDYIDCNNYPELAMLSKKLIVVDFLRKLKPKVIWDLGGNIGTYSHFPEAETICFDIDSSCVELNYLQHDKGVLPLVLDITNPSPSIGWDNNERMSFLQRGNADTVMALALIHHLAITGNLPFKMIAEFFHKICQSLIIEFVPWSDSQIRKLTMREIPTYTQENFEAEFKWYFDIKERVQIKDSERIIYLMERYV
jgi:hypothetical protein